MYCDYCEHVYTLYMYLLYVVYIKPVGLVIITSESLKWSHTQLQYIFEVRRVKLFYDSTNLKLNFT